MSDGTAGGSGKHDTLTRGRRPERAPSVARGPAAAGHRTRAAQGDLVSQYDGGYPPPPPGGPGGPPPGPMGQAPGGMTPPPPNHLVWAILTTLFCCLPLGIVTLVFSSQVYTKLLMGDTVGAQESAE